MYFLKINYVLVDFDVCERVMILVIASNETFKQVFCFAIL